MQSGCEFYGEDGRSL